MQISAPIAQRRLLRVCDDQGVRQTSRILPRCKVLSSRPLWVGPAILQRRTAAAKPVRAHRGHASTALRHHNRSNEVRHATHHLSRKGNSWTSHGFWVRWGDADGWGSSTLRFAWSYMPSVADGNDDGRSSDGEVFREENTCEH